MTEPRPRARPSRRFALALVALALALLVAEGAVSLATGRSLWRHARPAIASRVREQRDEERFAAAARLPGIYAAHPDPRVGFTFRNDARLAFGGVELVTDDLGLRTRPGAAPPAGALRVVVLGDSVAYGFGLPAEEALAHQLETVLAGARDAGDRPVACWTVAVPGWNHRNSIRFLRDHWDRFAPDVVLFLPVENDLDDTDGVYETGHRRHQLDPFSPRPEVPLVSNLTFLVTAAARLATRGITLDQQTVGPFVLTAGLSPVSRLGIASMAGELAGLQAQLQEGGGRLYLLPFSQRELLYHQVRAELAARGVQIGVIAALDRSRPEDTLGHDPHPNAETVRAIAIWAARSLLEDGVVAGSPERLPDMPPRLADRRAAVLSPEEEAAWVGAEGRRLRAALRPRIDARTGEGLAQIYGGVSADGDMGPALLALLPDEGERVTVVLAPLATRPDLYPLRVDVTVDDVAVGALVVTGAPGEEARGVFTRPAGAAGAPHEVFLRADRYGVVRTEGISRLVACRFLALACAAEGDR